MGARETMVPTRHGRIAVSDTGGTARHPVPARQFRLQGGVCPSVRAFRDSHRLIALDLPGHGVSDNADPEAAYNIPAYADVAGDVLAALGVERPFVLGWSLGGYVGLELTARDPARFAGLCITGTSPLNIVPGDFARGYDASSHLVLAGKQYFTAAEERAYAGSATAPLSPDMPSCTPTSTAPTGGHATT